MPENATITTLATFAKEIPIIGGILAIGIQSAQNKSSVGGNSDSADAYAKKTLLEGLEDTAKGKVEDRALKIIGKALGEAAKGIVGAFLTAFKAKSALTNVNKALQIPSRDAVVFKLFELAGLEPKASTAESVTSVMTAAYTFMELNSWFFINSAYTNWYKNYTGSVAYEYGPTLFSVLLQLNKMKADGKSKNKIQAEIKSYMSKYACANIRNTQLDGFKVVLQEATVIKQPNSPLVNPPLVMVPEVSQKFFSYAVENYSKVISSVASTFKQYINAVKSI